MPGQFAANKVWQPPRSRHVFVGRQVCGSRVGAFLHMSDHSRLKPNVINVVGLVILRRRQVRQRP
jgi:hypothetical protein